MDLRERMSRAFLKRLVARPEGRAHLLRELADAEGNGENGFFEELLAQVDDPSLRRLVHKHQADEVRHQQLFLACAARTGVAPEPVPDDVKYVERLWASTGFGEGKINGARGVMEAYLLLQAIEERSVTQFAILEQVLRPVDAQTADVLVQIRRDEERHIKYCQAIARRYAPDEASRVATLRRMRELEAQCFADNGAANMRYVFARGWFAGGPLVRWLFSTVQRLGGARPPLTGFADAEPAPRLEPAVAT
jgi:demethoxyubiquinone hydroxylase (CLK1/Coq7/Cat5 family)